MTIDNDNDLVALKKIGAIVARTLAAMGKALEPGMTTRELDAIGAQLLAAEGARPAPALAYNFPGATCISVCPDIAHGIPGDRVLKAGDLVNIDVSAELGGYFADTGASFVIPPVSARLAKLTRDGKRALWAGVNAVRAGAKLGDIGRAVQAFADRERYTLIQNLASHGVGRSLHEEPTSIATWDDPGERRRIHEGMVFTIEPFLSMGSQWAVDGGDEWTLRADTGRPTVQYEHTLVATARGALVLTAA
ncbi:type I methionyl aminopeptidase [Terricaulis sp.]|uniref:type I methionyl aminopeptidase n=1 Tax=Terricaulis sp. TaxID=2768686 RepID=UPI003783A1EF